MIKLGVIAGSGSLPKCVIEACIQKNIDYNVITLEGETDLNYPNAKSFKVYQISKIISYLHAKNIDSITLAGKVNRTKLTRLLIDPKGAILLWKIIKSGLADNSILTTIIKFLEDEGFQVIPPETIASEILITQGCLTKIKPDNSAKLDIEHGTLILNRIAALDVGQALVIQNKLVLAVEAAEGTDQMILRSGSLKQEGSRPILIKMCKPNQDKRVDLPVIGLTTIENAQLAGIRGIALQAGAALILDKEKVLELANKYKIFILGF